MKNFDSLNLKTTNLDNKNFQISKNIEWETTKAAIFRKSKNALKKVSDIDFIDIDLLVGLDRQKDEIIKNTKNFLDDKGANHALLWGDMGCGKSSLCKAVFTMFFNQNLRVIEISKHDLESLIDILDEIREINEYKFIIYIDDLSFEDGDFSYKFLKPVLEGSIELPPKNVLIYATSNRRHLVNEKMSNEIHEKEAVNERLSLAQRFGLQISFYEGGFSEYLDIVDSYFKGFKGDISELHLKAKQFAMLRASRSGRVAKQFYLAFKDEFKNDKK